MLGGLTALTLRLVGSERKAGEPEMSEEELRTLVDVGAREGVVERGEREMIHRVFELEDTLVREVMVPRPGHVLPGRRQRRASGSCPCSSENLHSRVPVFEDSVDQIVGVLYTKDLLPHLPGLPPDFDLRAHLHPPYFVPESKRADALLREFQAKKLHLAIVVDEYGGTAGLVTLEDLLEELVGEIRDEFDEEEPLIQPVGEHTFRVSGKLPIYELNEVTGLDIPTTPTTPWAAGCSTSSAACPGPASARERDGFAVSVEKVARTRVVEVLVRVPGPVAVKRAPEARSRDVRPGSSRDRAPGHRLLLGRRDGLHRRQPRPDAPPGPEAANSRGRPLPRGRSGGPSASCPRPR